MFLLLTYFNLTLSLSFSLLPQSPTCPTVWGSAVEYCKYLKFGHKKSRH